MKKAVLEMLSWVWYVLFTLAVGFYSSVITIVAFTFTNWTPMNIFQIIVLELSVVALLIPWVWVTKVLIKLLIKDIKKLIRKRRTKNEQKLILSKEAKLKRNRNWVKQSWFAWIITILIAIIVLNHVL
jgi:hypothetical protein